MYHFIIRGKINKPKQSFHIILLFKAIISFPYSAKVFPKKLSVDVSALEAPGVLIKNRFLGSTPDMWIKTFVLVIEMELLISAANMILTYFKVLKVQYKVKLWMT